MLYFTAVQNLVTLQDLGRSGWMRYGMPPSGAMDNITMRIANMLVGNPLEYACLEITPGVTSFTVKTERIRFATTGGILYINNSLRSPWTSHIAHYDDNVHINWTYSHGVWGYVAVAGGFDVPPILNSVSTYINAKLGGLNGQPLYTHCCLPLRQQTIPPNTPNLTIPPHLRPQTRTSIRVIPGPQENWFTQDSIQTFYSSPFTLSHQYNRMGYKLVGPPIVHQNDFNLISEPIAPGSIQIPGDQNPIVLLADRGTIGGYPKIATIISTDIHTFVQLPPSTQVSFIKITLKDAIKARQYLQKYLQNLPQYLHAHDVTTPLHTKTLIHHNLISGVCNATSYPTRC